MSKKEKFTMQIGDQVFSKGNDIGKFLVGIMHPKIYSTPIEQKYYPFLEAFIKQHPEVAEKTKDVIMDCCFVTSHQPFYPFTHSAKTTMHFYTKGGEIVTLNLLPIFGQSVKSNELLLKGLRKCILFARNIQMNLNRKRRLSF